MSSIPTWFRQDIPHTLGSVTESRERDIALVEVLRAEGWDVEERSQFGTTYWRVSPPGWGIEDQQALDYQRGAAIARSYDGRRYSGD